MLITIAMTAAVLIFATFILLTLFHNITPAIVMPDYKPCAGDWHEAHLNNCNPILTKIPQQPINTYTNLSYLAVGFMAYLLFDTYPSMVFLVTMVYLFIGSTLYHALSTRWAGILDVTAIFATYSATAVYALGVLVQLPPWLTAILMLIVGGLVAFLGSRRFRNQAHFVIGILLGTTYLLLVVTMWVSGSWGAWPYLLGSLVAFAVAFIIWHFDRAQTFPLKGWGHGIWHVLAAAASMLVFYAIHLTP